MLLRSFLICLATAANVAVIHSQAPTSSGNNLVESQSQASTKTDIKTAPSREIRVDVTKLNDLSDDELNALFDRISTTYSRDAVLFNNVGVAYYKRKLYDKATESIKRAIMINNHPAFLTNLSIIFDELGRTAEAMAAVQRAVGQAPRYARAREQMCELMMVGKRNADTIICYDELRKLAPLDAMAQTYYAVALLRSGSSEKAIALLEPITGGPQPPALTFNVLGYAYFQKKRYDRASEAFKRGVEIDPDNAELRYNLAISLAASNNRIGALSQYDLMKEKAPALADRLYRTLYRDKIIFVDENMASKKP